MEIKTEQDVSNGILLCTNCSILGELALVLGKDTQPILEMHSSRRVVASEIFVANEDNASKEHFFYRYFTMLVICEELVGVLHCLHILN